MGRRGVSGLPGKGRAPFLRVARDHPGGKTRGATAGPPPSTYRGWRGTQHHPQKWPERHLLLRALQDPPGKIRQQKRETVILCICGWHASGPHSIQGPRPTCPRSTTRPRLIDPYPPQLNEGAPSVRSAELAPPPRNEGPAGGATWPYAKFMVSYIKSIMYGAAATPRNDFRLSNWAPEGPSGTTRNWPEVRGQERGNGVEQGHGSCVGQKPGPPRSNAEGVGAQGAGQGSEWLWSRTTGLQPRGRSLLAEPRPEVSRAARFRRPGHPPPRSSLPGGPRSRVRVPSGSFTNTQAGMLSWALQGADPPGDLAGTDSMAHPFKLQARRLKER